jgi:putative Ca2+/H+ antiporter (TMEM165/GDT1 family)
MDYRIFFSVFATVFLAELGDKTQLATLLFASDRAVSKWMVFFAASAALVLCSAIGVLAGTWLSENVSARALRILAGMGFMLIGAWTLYRAA